MSTKLQSKSVQQPSRRAGEVRNGISRPCRGGIVQACWDLFDSANGEVTVANTRDIAAATGFALVTVQQELRRHTKWNAAPVRASRRASH